MNEQRAQPYKARHLLNNVKTCKHAIFLRLCICFTSKSYHGRQTHYFIFSGHQLFFENMDLIFTLHCTLFLIFRLFCFVRLFPAMAGRDARESGQRRCRRSTEVPTGSHTLLGLGVANGLSPNLLISRVS